MKVKSQNSFVVAASLDFSALFEPGLALQRAKRALIFFISFFISPLRQSEPGSCDPFEFHMFCTVLARMLLSKISMNHVSIAVSWGFNFQKQTENFDFAVKKFQNR